MAEAIAHTPPVLHPAGVRGTNVFETDANLRRLLGRRAPELLARYDDRLRAFGAWVGGPLDEQAAYTDRYAPPRLETHGPTGEPAGDVVANPAYLACHGECYRRGVIGLAYAEPRAPHLLSFTMGYLLAHADIALHCPVTLTGAVAYVLDRVAPPPVREVYLPQLVRMDGWAESGGTWATEREGGSDIGATTTEARPDGKAWRLSGLKWFASNAGSGLALATARPAGAPAGGRGLGCYLVPRDLPDGAPNRLWVRRLKDKLGTRGLATGEVELDGAWALEVAPPPHGLKAMMEALAYSRVHNAVAACGLHRRAFLEALGWAAHRRAFGRRLCDHPMVRDTLLDLVTELEAGVALAFEAACAFDAALADEARRPWLRTVTALAKHRTAERAVRAAAAAVELLGGNGYTEDWITARLYRDALVLPVWEGPANVQALELLRVVADKAPGDRAFLDRVTAIRDALPGDLMPEAAALTATLSDCRDALTYLRAHPDEGPRHARRLMDLMADTLGAALLLEEAAAEPRAGDGRKALVAKRFLRTHFAGRPAIGPDRDPAHAAFDAIVGAGLAGP